MKSVKGGIPNMQKIDNISYCDRCNCMTKTINLKCGKCNNEDTN